MIVTMNTGELRYALVTAKYFSRAARNLIDSFERQTVINFKRTENEGTALVQFFSYRDDVGRFSCEIESTWPGTEQMFDHPFVFESDEGNAAFRALKPYDQDTISVRVTRTDDGMNLLKFVATDDERLLYQVPLFAITLDAFIQYKRKYWIEDGADDTQVDVRVNAEQFIEALKLAATVVKTRAAEGKVLADLARNRIVVESRAGLMMVKEVNFVGSGPGSLNAIELNQNMFWLMQTVAIQDTLDLSIRQAGGAPRMMIKCGWSTASFRINSVPLADVFSLFEFEQKATVEIGELWKLCDTALARKLPYCGFYLEHTEGDALSSPKVGLFAGMDSPGEIGKLQAGLVSEIESEEILVTTASEQTVETVFRTENLYRALAVIERESEDGKVTIWFQEPMTWNGERLRSGAGPVLLTANNRNGSGWYLENFIFNEIAMSMIFTEIGLHYGNLGTFRDYEQSTIIGSDSTDSGAFLMNETGDRVLRLLWVSSNLELVKLEVFDERMRVTATKMLAMSTFRSKRFRIVRKVAA
jgi:hypothetical protein